MPLGGEGPAEVPAGGPPGQPVRPRLLQVSGQAASRAWRPPISQDAGRQLRRCGGPCLPELKVFWGSPCVLRPCQAVLLERWWSLGLI